MKKKLNRKQAVLVILLGLSAVSLTKYVLYEISGVRNSIGKTVILPEDEAVEALRKMTGRANRGTLRSARYRWNDKVGFFDLAVEVEYDDGHALGGRSVGTGLSPFEAMKLKIQEPQKDAAVNADKPRD